MIIDESCRYVSLTGNDIPTELYSKIIELDSQVFAEGSDDYEADTSMPPEVLMSFLKKNILTTTIIYDQIEDRVIGYYQAFPLKDDFLQKYVSGQTTFKEMTDDDVEKYVPTTQGQKLYIWSIGIDKEYRGKKIEDFPSSKLNGKSPVKIMVEALANAVINLRKQGVKISEIYCEGVSDKGQALASDLTDGRLLHSDEEKDFLMYGNVFKFENMVKRLPEDVKNALIEKYNAVSGYSKTKLGDNMDRLVVDTAESEKLDKKRDENDI